MSTAQAESSQQGEIRGRLDAPLRQASLPELAGFWFTHRTALRIDGYGALVSDPGLPGRIRGAFGAVLMEGASRAALEGRPCSYSPPSAFEALFRKQGRMTKGLDYPSPWVIGVDAEKGDLVVTLTLFGFASEWGPAAAEALTSAARERVDWRGASEIFLPKLEIGGRVAGAVEGVMQNPSSNGMTLDFLSPLAFSGAHPRNRPESLLTGLGFRLSGLARWHDADLSRTDWRSLKETAKTLGFDFGAAREICWTRGSKRQDREIPMRGLIGALTVEGAITPEIAALVALGETCHMGADVALGCGRYRVFV